MITENFKPCGILIEVVDIDKYVDFLTEVLEFTIQDKQENRIVLSQNGFYVLVKKSNDENMSVSVEGFCGIEHFALATADASKAINYYKFNNISLNTDCGAPYDNPGIWKLGTKYFDFVYQNDLKVEICERLDPPEPEKTPFRGLSHIGMPVSNHDRAIDFYKKIGFVVDCTVNVKSEAEGSYICSMLVKDGFWLEVYEMIDIKNKVYGHGAIKGIVCLSTAENTLDIINSFSKITEISSDKNIVIAKATDEINIYFMNEL